MKQFNREYKIAVDIIKDKLDTVVVKSSEKLMEGIIEDTPVETGQLKGNWQASLEVPITKALIGTTDPGGDITKQKAFNVIQPYNLKTSIFFVNNLNYATRIEYGRYSRKAPAGMVRINLRKFGNIIKEEARAASKRSR